jgi:colicin import membrane protein
MVARQTSADAGLSVSFIFSAVIHVAVFLFMVWLGTFVPKQKLQETYYVDMVNLPVDTPQPGSPTQKENDSEQVPAPLENKMILPMQSKPAARTKPAASVVKRPHADSDSSSFAERMAKLEQKTEEDALAKRLSRLKTGGSGKTGMPDGKGKEAGSDYTSYIQSRLSDAFRETISYSSKSPEVVVRLIIDADGKVSRRKAERSSGDRAFEISVLRAIDIAAEKFTPPPSRKAFEGVFIFRPKGISQEKQ